MATPSKWSEMQLAIFKWAKFPHGSKRNLIVRARAGTGKSTTTFEMSRQAPERKIIYCAFNKRIQTEAAEKIAALGIQDKVEAKTFHGIGFGFTMRNRQGAKPNEDRTWGVARQASVEIADLWNEEHENATEKVPPGEPGREMLTNVVKLASLGKNINPLCKSPAELTSIGEAFSLFVAPADEDDDAALYPAEWVCRAAYRAMEISADPKFYEGEIDFDDMIYLPVRLGWTFPRWDMVIVDEAQDMNNAQLLLAQRIVKPNGRIVIVGDDKQAIYGFRGANSGAIDSMKEKLKADELPLSITYRCPKKIVELAARLVPDYQAAPEAPEGEVTTMHLNKLVGMVQPGDFVLSRLNAPLMRLCLQTLKVGKRAKVEGRDVGANLASFVKKLKARTLAQFETKLQDWQDREHARIWNGTGSEKAKETKQAEIEDKCDCLRALAEGLATVPELQKRIEDLFADNEYGQAASTVVFSSVNKAKGVERDRVFCLIDTMKEGGEESNIKYVALTRSKKSMYLVTEKAIDGGLKTEAPAK